jgi:hypothetical protein
MRKYMHYLHLAEYTFLHRLQRGKYVNLLLRATLGGELVGSGEKKQR